MSGTDLRPREQWGVAPYGILGAPPVRNIGDPVEKIRAEIDRHPEYKNTPVRRMLVTVDGVEYASPWMRVPTEAQRVAHPAWPAETEMI